MTKPKTKILIVGGGFGGIKTALELADDTDLEVTLLSDQDSFRYYPALYLSATGGGTAASNIPLSEIFKGKNIKIVKGAARRLDRESKAVKTTTNKKLPYDVLVLALGVVTNYFGIKGLKEYSFGIKSQEEAARLREHIHKQLLEDGGPELNYVVIGGGPTGVELAGALPAYINHVAKHHGLKPRKFHVDLIEAAPRLVPRMPQSYSRAVQQHLRRLGVKLFLKQAVQAETHDALMVGEHPIRSHTVIWTAGVTNHPFFDANKFAMADHGKVKVDEFLQAEPDIYVIGDNAGTPYSGMAQTALYDAGFVAANLKRQARGEKPHSYKPKKPVYITPAGPEWAAVLWNRTHFYGWLGWLLRSAADFAGYHDYEPWWPASRHWLAEYGFEDSCPVCAEVK